MNENETENELLTLLWFLVFLATLIHVFLESKRMKENPFWTTLMVAVCVWPLGYLFWIFYWPGSVRKKLSGQKRREPLSN